MRIDPQISHQAFTRTELCVVIGVGGVLAGMVLPSLAREQSLDWRAVCLRRMSQLANAMAMYAVSNQDYLPPNPDDGNTTAGHNWCPGEAGVGGQDEFNADILKDASRSLLAPYFGDDVAIFKCPTDSRIGKYSGTVDVNPNKKGTQVPAARSVSLNGAVGTNPSKAGSKTPVDGPWLDGNHSHLADKTWYCYARMSDIVKPGPALTFTFIEEDPKSLNDGALSCMGPNPENVYKMIDWPLTYHGMSGAVTFADSHVEMHRWVDNRTIIGPTSFAGVQTQSGSLDLEWLALHASARINP